MEKTLLSDLDSMSIGTRLRGYIGSCQRCGKKFLGRADAKWCSNACGSQIRVSRMRTKA